MVVVAPMVVPLVVAPLAMVSLVPAPVVMAPMMLHMPSLGPVMVLGPRPTLSPPLVMVSHVQVPAILQVMAMRWGSAHMQTPLLQVVMTIVISRLHDWGQWWCMHLLTMRRWAN